MGVIRKAAKILTLGGMSEHSRHEPQAAAAKAQTERSEAAAKIAKEQAAVIARALQEDEAYRHTDLQEVAEEEAEAVPWNRPADS